MVIWLRQPRTEPGSAHASVGVGVEGDIVPRESLAQLAQLDEGLVALQMQHAQIIAEAHDEASRIAAAAASDAAAVRAQAQREFDTASERGYDAGRREAMAEWYTRTAQLLGQRQVALAALRERIAKVVVSAVEKIVESEQPAAMFARASAAVERIVDDSSHLRVRVHPDEHDAACEAFARAAAGWRERDRPVQLTVIADHTLSPRACICESDIGSIDASIDVQLDAIRVAVANALAHARPQTAVPGETALVSATAHGEDPMPRGKSAPESDRGADSRSPHASARPDDGADDGDEIASDEAQGSPDADIDDAFALDFAPLSELPASLVQPASSSEDLP